MVGRGALLALAAVLLFAANVGGVRESLASAVARGWEQGQAEAWAEHERAMAQLATEARARQAAATDAQLTAALDSLAASVGLDGVMAQMEACDRGDDAACSALFARLLPLLLF